MEPLSNHVHKPNHAAGHSRTVQLICILFSQIMWSLGWSCVANLIGINTFQTDNLTRSIFISISWPKLYQMELWPKKLVTRILEIPSKNVLWLNYIPLHKRNNRKCFSGNFQRDVPYYFDAVFPFLPENH